MKKVSICGVKIDNFSFDKATKKCIDMINDPSPNSLFTPNTDFIVRSIKDIKFKNILNNSDLNVADGVPLVWASRLLGTPIKEKIAGSDLFFKICKIASIEG